MYSQHLAHASDPDKSIPAIEVSSAAPGEISVTWSEPPHRYGLKDYRLTYGVMNNGEAFTSYKIANSSTGGNVYPGRNATSYTITGLDAGTYGVQIRARYEDWQNGPFKASGSVSVAGSSEANDVDTRDSDTDPPTPSPTPTPEPLGTVTIIDDPTPEPPEEPQIAPQIAAQDDVTLPSNALFSVINQASSGTITVRPFEDVAARFTMSESDAGWDLDKVLVRVGDSVDSGEYLSLKLVGDNAIAGAPTGPTAGSGGPTPRTYSRVSVRNGIATFSNPSPSRVHPRSELGWYFVFSVNSGEVEIGKTTSTAQDSNTPTDWTIHDTWHRSNNRWPVSDKTSDKVQMVVTGARREAEPAATPVPTAVPTRPSTPRHETATTYRLGRWQSVTLDDSIPLHRVRLSSGTNYRLELRTANESTAATAFDGEVALSEYVIDVQSVHDDTGPQYLPAFVGYVEGEATYGDPARHGSTFVHNGSPIDGYFANLQHKDFRTATVYSPTGHEDCNEAREVGLKGSDCIYRYNFPHYHYITISTGIGQSGSYFGTMQFRITRASDQTTTGMTSQKEASGGRVSALGNNLPQQAEPSAMPPVAAGIEQIDFDGDIDWYRVSGVSQSCYTIAPTSTDGAAGLKARVFDVAGDAVNAPSRRGSYSRSLSVTASSQDAMLEVAGTGSGGYTIEIVDCPSVPTITLVVTPTATAVPIGDRAASCVSDFSPRDELCDDYDDLLPRHYANNRVQSALTDERRLPTSFGRISVGGTASGALEQSDDWDIFKIEVSPNTDYRVRVTSTSRRVSLPAEVLVPGVSAVPAVPEVPDNPDTPDINEYTPAVPAIIGIPEKPALAEWSYTYQGVRQEDLRPIMLAGVLFTDDNGTPGDTSDDTYIENCELKTRDEDGPAWAGIVSSHVSAGEITFSSEFRTCVAVAVISTTRDRSVGGYRIRLTLIGATPIEGSDDDYSPLIATEQNTWYTDHIIGEWDHDGDPETVNQSLSQTFGRVSRGRGSGEIDTYLDIDLFRHSLSAGEYKIQVYDARELNTACKTSARSRGENCVDVQTSLQAEAHGMMRMKLRVFNGIIGSLNYATPMAFNEAAVGTTWCTGAVNFSAEAPAVAGVRPTCERPVAEITQTITVAGDYYFGVSARNVGLSGQRQTGPYTIEVTRE